MNARRPRHRRFPRAATATALVLLAAGGSAAYYWGPSIPRGASWHRGDLALIDGARAEEAATDKEEREVLYWYDPMVPDVHFDKPGPSPFMDMDLVPRYAGEDEGGVRLTSRTMQQLGIRIAEARRESLRPLFDTFGRVEYDETGIEHAHTRIEGWIEQLHVRAEGERVERGQALFELYSPALINAQRELLQVLARERDLETESARERLRAMGMSGEQIRALEERATPFQTITVHARQSGVVQALNVRQGMHVTPGTETMSLADLSRVWVIADVFERDVAHLRLGQAAQVRFPFLPGITLAGEVDYVYPVLDRLTRTVPVRLVFENNGDGRGDGWLKPGMYASVEIEGSARESAVTVPREAVIRTGREDRVMRYLGEGLFEPQRVTLGALVNGRLEILAGLEEGDKVVTSGVFLLDSETNVRDFAARAAADMP
ncbi:MAG: efflux RND transporter periplasmic adaptor subunit, partial [Gammaproteobacteria bacterium]